MKRKPKKNYKRWVAMLLLLIMMVTAVPQSLYASELSKPQTQSSEGPLEQADPSNRTVGEPQPSKENQDWSKEEQEVGLKLQKAIFKDQSIFINTQCRWKAVPTAV